MRRTIGALAARTVAAVAFAVLGAAADDEFAAKARAFKDASSWTELEAAAAARVAEDGDDLRARAYLAVAFAGGKKFAEAVDQLRAIDAAGRSVDAELAGFGAPAAEVLQAIWSHAWANWTPEFNRRCWGDLFEAFPDVEQAAVPASRLLMAALKLGDAAEEERLSAWFGARLEAARAAGDPSRILHLWAQARVRAGAGGDETTRLARAAYDAAWGAAAARHGEGDPAAVEECDLDCDKAYDDLVLAAELAGDREALGFREGTPAVRFDDVTEAAGLGGLRKARVAVGDYDADGDPDLCLQGALYENDGGSFADVTAARGLAGGAASALFGDPDGDGDLDLLLVKAPHPVLFSNLGRREAHRFEDVTAGTGLDRVTLAATPEGAAWWDRDGDGDLDLYLALYEGALGVGNPDVVLENRGDGTFVDATEASGIAAAGTWCGRGVSPVDVDDDGDQDLFVSNYRLNRNVLFRCGPTGMVDVAADLGVHGFERQGAFGHTIGSCFGDVDGDGDLDLFSANLAHPRFVRRGFSNLSTLLMNPGPDGGPWVDERRARGIRFQETHSDPAFVDFDADGDLDLSITCVYEGVPSALYENDGEGRFTPVTCAAGAVQFNGWGHAWFDKDDDGDLDVLFASNSGVRLFENRGAPDHRWLKVRLEGRAPNRFGIGARVVVETDEEPPRRQVRELSSARGTTSQDGEVLHFGLGPYKGRVRVAVRWPGTSTWQRRAFFVNRTVTLKQPR